MYYIFHLSQFGGNFTKIILDDVQANLNCQVKSENADYEISKFFKR